MNKKNSDDRALLQVFVEPALKVKVEKAAKKEGLTTASLLRSILTKRFS